MNSTYISCLGKRSNQMLICCLIMLIMLCVGCNKDKTLTPAPETATLTDRDGNVYKTIKIGSQWWMMENLKVKTYLNGDSISYLYDSILWHHTHNGAWSFFDSAQAKNAPGLLYNAYAVSDSRGLAPAGWHISSDDDWAKLEEYLGMSQDDAGKIGWRGSNEAEKLKKARTQSTITGDWTQITGIWNTNETRFTALAGGCRIFNGHPGDPGIGSQGFWWTSSVRSTDGQMWYRYMDYKNSKIFRYVAPFTYGCSIRCVKDPQ